MILIGAWLAAGSALIGLIMRHRAAAHDRIVGGVAAGGDAGARPPENTRLAHWTYEYRPWLEHALRDYDRDRAAKWAIWRIIAVFCLVFGAIFYLAAPDRDAGSIVALVLLGMLVLIAGVVHLTTRVSLRHHLMGPGQVYVGRDGVWYNGALHVWRGWGARLERVGYPDPSGNLSLSYSVPARYGRQYHELRIPIPDGSQAEAERVAAELGTMARRGGLGAGRR